MDDIGSLVKRYDSEPVFRRLVNEYMEIPWGLKTRLGIGKAFRSPWYEHRLTEIMAGYAARIEEDKKTIAAISQAALELKQTAAVTEQAGEALDKSRQEAQEIGFEAATTDAKLESEKVSLSRTYSHQVKEAEDMIASERQKILQATDPSVIIAESLRKHLESSRFVRKQKDGRLTYDEEYIASRIENMCLDDILGEIEQGTPGFYANLRQSYLGLVSHWDEIEDLSELPLVDWTQSLIYARTKGHAYPEYPSMIAGKETMRHVESLYSAIITDRSGSMDGHKLDVARDTSLALKALLERLDRKNGISMGLFSTSAEKVDSLYLLKNLQADGYTRTDLALEWLLEECEGKPSIAYLVTDGEPAGPGDIMDRTIKAARMFRDHPYIRLRIFLVDGNAATRKIVKRIAEEAGPEASAMQIDYKRLGSEVIIDVGKTIGQMYS